jgi:hypothetical protein
MKAGAGAAAGELGEYGAGMGCVSYCGSTGRGGCGRPGSALVGCAGDWAVGALLRFAVTVAGDSRAYVPAEGEPGGEAGGW